MSTIAAISTPNAVGGIGIIRISGENATEICEKCFTAFSGKKPSAVPGYTALYGEVSDPSANEAIDEAVVIVYKAPKSYTGEDVVEICCHGGLYIMQRVLRLILSLGAKPAEAGEFTKRAYLNGKMDLAQAESVMNVISAQGSAALNAAQNTLKGAVSKKIDTVASSLVTAAAGLAAWADYPDEDIPSVESGELLKTLKEAAEELKKLIKNYDSGKAVTQGVNTVICGKPNVGKSTLMNLLSGYSRSIVTSVAGTTRDVVEETVRVGDILLRLQDTAGIRETDDEVESIGVEIAKERMESADLILAVFDISRPLGDEDIQLLKACEHKNAIGVINKTDLEKTFDEEEIKKYIKNTVSVCAKKEESSELLKTALEKELGTKELDFTQEMLAGERQLDCVKKALDCVNEAISALEYGLTVDAVNVSIDCAIEELYTLTGKRASEAIVAEVFSKFCVGK